MKSTKVENGVGTRRESCTSKPALRSTRMVSLRSRGQPAQDSKIESISSFSPTSYQKVSAEKPILTQTIRINFYPNSSNIFEPQHDELGQPMPNTLYDPNVNATIEKVARLAGQFERAIIAVVGHTDSSMKGRIPESLVQKLSQDLHHP